MADEITQPKEIEIVGHPGRKYKYSDVRTTVVKIKDLYYRKDSKEIVKIQTPNGLRFFREKSPLIIKLDDGTHILKSQAVKTEDGVYLDPTSPDVVKINDKYVRKLFCVAINNKWYLKTDPLLVVDRKHGNYIFKETATLLNESLYGKNQWAPSDKVIKTKEGEVCYAEDCMRVYDFEKDDVAYTRKGAKSKYVNILIDFQDKTNPQEDRLVFISAEADEITKYCVSITLVEGISTTYSIPKTKLKYFQDAIDKYIMPRLLADIEKLRAKVNKNFSDLDPKENVAKMFKNVTRPWPGKQEIFKPASFRVPVIGKTFTKTGGLKYSFGVEFETSQGLLPNKAAEDVGLFIVGDRSIGAAEYVTAPMKGDAGIEMLEAQCNALRKHTLVDDRCGVHVHVGSLFSPTEAKLTPTPKEAPSFDKNFLINSIRLGAYIEEELFESLPSSRVPTLYHCHSIRRFKNINETNFDTFLGAYIFGPKEKWLDEHGEPVEPFKMSQYKLSKDRNQNSELGVWAEGRYKWLNLIHSYTRSRHRTIEFRIFSPTTVFEKVYAYVLTSMAFTYVVDNKSGIIKEGVTLSQVFDAAFPKHAEIRKFLNDFYAERKAKFKRKNIYPKLEFLK